MGSASGTGCFVYSRAAARVYKSMSFWDDRCNECVLSA